VFEALASIHLRRRCGKMLRTKYNDVSLSREEVFFLKDTTKMHNYSCEVNVG